MRVFILEDDPSRMLYLRERLLAHDILHIESSTHSGCYQPPYDLLLLDHDLGGRQLEDHEDDGQGFVRRVKDQIMAQDPRPYVIIHSYNPEGAYRMQQALLHMTTCMVAPFRSAQFNRLLTQIEATVLARTSLPLDTQAPEGCASTRGSV